MVAHYALVILNETKRREEPHNFRAALQEIMGDHSLRSR